MSDRRGRFAVLTALAALWAPAAVEGQSWREVTMSRQLREAAPVRAEVSYAAGTFTLRGTEEPLLYRVFVRYDEDVFRPVAEVSGDRLHIGLEGEGRFSLRRGQTGGTMNVELARGLPMDLDLEFGAVKADLDLGGLALRELELSTGASESRIDISEPNPVPMTRARFEVGAADFTLQRLGNLGAERIDVEAGVGHVSLSLDGTWRANARLSVQMGLGALEIRVPEGLGVRVRKDSFLTSFDPEGLVKRGDSYYSLDWEQAERNVTIDLDAAFGSVEVVWIP